jgi:hypothetical protein
MDGLLIGWKAVADRVSQCVGRKVPPSTIKSAVSEGRLDIKPGKAGGRVCVNEQQFTKIMEWASSQVPHELTAGEARTLETCSKVLGEPLGAMLQQGQTLRALLAVTYSLPYDRRGSLEALEAHMFLVEQTAEVIARGECQKTLTASPEGCALLAQHAARLRDLAHHHDETLARKPGGWSA